MSGCFYNGIRHNRFFVATWSHKLRISNGGAGGFLIDETFTEYVCGRCKNIYLADHPNAHFEKVTR